MTGEREIASVEPASPLVRRFRFGLDQTSAQLVWAVFFTAMAVESTRRYQPLYLESLGATPALVGILAGVSELVRMIGLIIAGPLSDRLPARTLLRFRAGMLAALSTWLFAQTWWQVFPAYLFGGTANLAWSTVSRTVDSAGEEGRDRRFMLVYSIGPSVTTLIGPVIAGFVASSYGLREVYIVALAFQAVSVSIFLRVRPTRVPPPAGRGGASYMDVIRHRPAAVVCLLTMVIGFSVTVSMTLAPNYMHNVAGISLGAIGAVGTLVAVGSIGAGLLVTRVRWLQQSARGLLLTAALIPGVGLLLLIGGSVWVFGCAFLVWGFAVVAQQTLYGLLGAVSPTSLRGRSFALFEVMSAAGGMLAGFAAGALYDVSPTAPLWAALFVGFATFGAVLAGRRYLLGWQRRQAVLSISEPATD